MVVYLITNLVNGKYYVGKTIHAITKRWRQHQSDARRGSPMLISRAIRRYGVQNFSISELSHGTDEEQLYKKEMEFVAKFRSNNPAYGYNGTLGGDGARGWRVTDEKRQHMSAAHKGKSAPWNSRPRTEQELQALRQYAALRRGKPGPRRGVVVSQESKAKMRAAKLGKSTWNKGKKRSNVHHLHLMDSWRNSQHSLKVQWNGETILLIDLCRIMNVPYRRTFKRIYDRGWSVDRAIVEAPHLQHCTKKYRKAIAA